MPSEQVPALTLIDRWCGLIPQEGLQSALAIELRRRLEDHILPRYIAGQRWYAGKGAAITHARIVEALPWQGLDREWLIALVELEGEGEAARYFLPLTLVFGAQELSLLQGAEAATIACALQPGTSGVLAEAFADEHFCRALIREIGRGSEWPTAHGRVRFAPTSAYAVLCSEPLGELTVSLPRAQGSNTALKLGDRLFLKALRHVQPGVNPEFEVGRFLTEVAHFPHVVPLAGAVEYVDENGVAATLLLLQGYVEHECDGWEYTVHYLTQRLEERPDARQAADDVHGSYLALIRTLARRTAELHVALASESTAPAFAPEALTADDLMSWRARVREEAAQTFDLLARSIECSDAVRPEGSLLLARRDAFERRLARVAPAGGLKLRHHGDYHLGQVLLQGQDFIIVDFEGEPARALEERRQKSSPLRDVAGMLRSFSYARHAALQRSAPSSAEDRQRSEAFLRDWERQTRAAFITTYGPLAHAAGLYATFEQMRSLLELFELEKALYELRYELNNRPDWAEIPMRSLLAFTIPD